MTVPVVLGLDVQWTRLGMAIVEFESPHRALWADTARLDDPEGGLVYQQVARRLGDLDWKRTRYGLGDRKRTEITRVGIEQPSTQFNAFKAGGVFHLALAECHRRWPWAPQVVRQPAQWKKEALGDGRASKAAIARWACKSLGLVITTPGGAELRPAISQDACDALGVAVAAAKVELEVAA